MTENFSERIENALNDIQKIQLLFRQQYGEECLADKEIEEVLKIAKAQHQEIQQYRAIGTVEECREARERQRGKKIILNSEDDREHEDYICPNCKDILQQRRKGATRITIYKFKYCHNCGCKLDWSDAI